MRPVQFYAYHGTSSSNASQIVATGDLKAGRRRNDHWLGYGSYFFREDLEQAAFWASQRYRRSYQTGNDTPAVIEAKIKMDSEYFLNLDSREGLQFLKDHILDLTQNRGVVIEADEEQLKTPVTACLVISAIDTEYKWAIMRTFPVHKSVFTNDEHLDKISFIHSDNLIEFGLVGTQVCVRNNKAVEKIESIKVGKQADANIVLKPVRREKFSNDLFSK